MENPYLALTAEYNHGRLRALLSSGQAVVLHRLAVMSKDGDWILREDQEALDHILTVLSGHGASYRFGAPLDLRWLAEGWSSHLEFRRGALRVRTDFVTRPPRISSAELALVWEEAEVTGSELMPLEPLAAIKLTNREKDYAVVGELARRMTNPESQLRYSRSGRDLVELARKYPAALEDAARQRPVLHRIRDGREAIEEALDRERRGLIRSNEQRLDRYRVAAAGWQAVWPEILREVDGLSLLEAHRKIVARAEGVLPSQPGPEASP